MLCWSCGKEIADDAIRCRHCEADVTGMPSDHEIESAREFLENMDPEVRSEMFRVFETSRSGEEFVNRIMVGKYPKCGSEKTGDCENDPDIEDITMGRCFECGYVWCTICDTPHTPAQDGCQMCQELGDDLEDWTEAGLEDESPMLERNHLLAAEIFNYSFANYRSHLGGDHERFETLMPEKAELLERAVKEDWSAARLSEVLRAEDPENLIGEGPTEKQCEKLLDRCRQALEVVDAETPAESFRCAVRQCVEYAIEKGLRDGDSVEQLVTQICYRASDLSVLLDMEEEPLSLYSRDLRRSTEKRDMRFGDEDSRDDAE